MMQSPRILFIDGLPGSGKSTAAAEIGRRHSQSRVFLESHPGHPLLVGAPDEVGAAFANIHQIHSVDSFAHAALEKLEVFLKTVEGDVLYVFESHPVQSTVRVLLQLDAPEPTIIAFWSNLQNRLGPLVPGLVYFRESDPRRAIEEIFRARGPAWERYVVEAINQSPWMNIRGLSGIGGVLEMFGHYAACMDRLMGLWRFPILTLAARPVSYEARTRAMIEWVKSSER
jgi:hypothetical protein